MTRNAAMLALLAALSGCATPDPSLYTLDLAPAAGPAAATPGLAVAVRRVGIPAYADRPEIVRAEAGLRVVRAAGAHWAGPLDDLMTSVLAADLRARLTGAGIVDTTGPIAPGKGAVAVSVQITRLGEEEPATLVLVAQYTIGGGAPRLAHLRTALNDGSTGAYVAGVSAAMGALADRIAQGLRETRS